MFAHEKLHISRVFPHELVAAFRSNSVQVNTDCGFVLHSSRWPTFCTRQSNVSLSSEEGGSTQESTTWDTGRGCRPANARMGRGSGHKCTYVALCHLVPLVVPCDLGIFHLTSYSQSRAFVREDDSFLHNVSLPWESGKKMVRNREVYSQWKICVLQTVLSAIARLVIFFSA